MNAIRKQPRRGKVEPRRPRPTPAQDKLRIYVEQHPVAMLEVRVVYSQVPEELADRFATTVRIDAEMGSLIRASAVLYAIRDLLRVLEAQGLLAEGLLT